ncbi:MAG TPA: hypothetical protein VL916_11695, partial [Ilumatobacteraceae bacterium]|nr:hypothetical protein [Ilumatobacteraceae bacterium]
DFGSNGEACIDFPDFNGASISDLVVQADDRVVALSHAQPFNQAARVALARLATDGTTDATVSQSGVSGSSFELGQEMALLPDGDLLVIGITNAAPFDEVGLVLSRFVGSTLALNATFGDVGTPGMTTESVFLNTSDPPVQLAVQADGLEFSVTITGTQDNGSGGVVAAVEQLIFDTDDGQLNDSPNDIDITGQTFLQQDDLVATPNGYISLSHFENATGDGIVAVPFGQDFLDPQPLIVEHPDGNLPLAGGAGVLLPDGNVLFASVFHGPGGEQLLFNAFTEDPNADPRTVALDPDIGSAFGEPGFLTQNMFLADPAQGVVVQPDSKVVVGGFSRPATSDKNEFVGNDGYLLRYNENGSLDANFGDPGRPGVAFVDFNVHEVALGGGGTIVAAGSQFFPGDGDEHTDGAVQRFLADGSPDTAWNEGFASYQNLASFNEATLFRDVAVQPDGKVVVVGDYVDCTSGCQAVIIAVRYLTDGTPDPGFGTNGVATVGSFANGEGETIGQGIAMQPDGKIVVSGDIFGEFFVARLDSGGDLDPAFGGDGIVNAGFTGIGRDVAVRANGRVAVAGDLVVLD